MTTKTTIYKYTQIAFHDPNETIALAIHEGHMLDFDDNLNGDQNIDDYDMVGDTSSTQAKVYKDIQGIPLERLNITREGYKRTRLEQYLNYKNIPLSGEAVVKEYNTKVEKVGNLWKHARSFTTTFDAFPATFQPFRQRHVAGETYPQRNVAGEKLMG
ncbi:hypothetical protein Tco_1302742, partial [Tanacetum coccineum]